MANFTLHNITTNSTDVSWNFYTWDIVNPLLLWINIYVLLDEVVFSRMLTHIMGNEKSYFSQHVTGLRTCTHYTIRVEGHYGVKDRTLQLPFRTECTVGLGGLEEGWIGVSTMC